jgi:hypothetical protein
VWGKYIAPAVLSSNYYADQPIVHASSSTNKPTTMSMNLDPVITTIQEGADELVQGVNELWHWAQDQWNVYVSEPPHQQKQQQQDLLEPMIASSKEEMTEVSSTSTIFP